MYERMNISAKNDTTIIQYGPSTYRIKKNYYYYSNSYKIMNKKGKIIIHDFCGTIDNIKEWIIKENIVPQIYNKICRN